MNFLMMFIRPIGCAFLRHRCHFPSHRRSLGGPRCRCSLRRGSQKRRADHDDEQCRHERQTICQSRTIERGRQKETLAAPAT